MGLSHNNLNELTLGQLLDLAKQEVQRFKITFPEDQKVSEKQCSEINIFVAQVPTAKKGPGQWIKKSIMAIFLAALEWATAQALSNPEQVAAVLRNMIQTIEELIKSLH